MVVRPYSVRQLHNYNLKQSHPPIMLHDNRASPRRLVRHLFPNRIDVWSFEITGAVPAPTPYYQTHSSDGEQQEKRKGTNLLLGRDWIGGVLLLQVRTDDRVGRTTICLVGLCEDRQGGLRGACTRGWRSGFVVLGGWYQTLSVERLVRSQIKKEMVRSQKTHRIISKLNPGHHHNPPIPRLPIIVTDQTTLARAALPLRDPRHPKPHMWRRVKRRRIKHRNPIPAALHLNR